MPVVVIRDELALPPSWLTSFRDLTLYVKILTRADVVVETDDEDPIWKWLRSRGAMDYVDALVRTGTQAGIRVDNCSCLDRPSPDVLVDRIAIENLHTVIRKVSACTPRPASVVDVLLIKAGS